jgi:hypothetical protein
MITELPDGPISINIHSLWILTRSNSDQDFLNYILDQMVPPVRVACRDSVRYGMLNRVQIDLLWSHHD